MESPRLRKEICGREREKKRKAGREKDGRCGKLVARQEEVCEIETRTADRACGGGKSNRFTFDSPAKPVEKLFFLAFDNYGITSDPERGDDRPMRLQVAREPVGPVRHSRDAMNMSDRSPHDPVIRTCQQCSSRTRPNIAGSKFFGQTN